ncbi:MAG: ABC transporter ATP-binding protein [Sulfurimonas sp.]|jgi:putative ABC transport system ATP-binding protein
MIELKNSTKIYELNRADRVVALNDVSLSIKEGEVVVLKGASGSGKSSILSLIAALSKPTSGEVIVDSKKISKLSDNFASIYRRDNIGFVFQKYNLIPSLSVRDNILLPLVPLNPDAKDAENKLALVMEMFQIAHKADAIVKNLSGGEQQRVAIARANINNPKIILADEPTANLDEKLSLSFIEILKELKSLNKTIIVATHDPLFFNLDFVDSIVEIHNGIVR